MKIFKQISDSVYSPKYYLELGSKPFSYSVKYFLLFALIFSLLFALRYGLVAIPEIRSAIKKVGPTVVSSFPEELEVVIRDGKVSTNVQEPYFIKTPKSLDAQSSEQLGDPENIVVIDTKNNPNIKKLEEYDTLVLITEEHITYREDKGAISTQSLKDFPNMTLNRNTVSDFSNKYSPYLNWMLPIIFVMIFFGGLFYVVLRLFYLVFAALLVWIIFKIFGVEGGYVKSYQFGLHLMTLPFLAANLVPLSFPLAFTAFFLLAAIANIRKGIVAEEPDAKTAEPIIETRPQLEGGIIELPPANLEPQK